MLSIRYFCLFFVWIGFSVLPASLLTSKTVYQPSLRYVESGSSRTRYRLLVPRNGCGSDVEADEEATVANTIVIQMNENIQEIWDTAKRISCVWSTQLKKKVNFKPFQVSMLDVVSTTFQGDDIKCWMDIRKGVYPETTELDDTVSIGESVSLLIYLQDSENKADVGIRDCWASGGEDKDKDRRLQVQLTSEEGCVLRPKLMAEWKKVYEVINGKATLVAHATISAFKFPDRAYVHMTCNVEICNEKCKQCHSEEDLSLLELALHIKEVDISTTGTSNNIEPRKKQYEKPSTHLPEQELITIARQKHPEDFAFREFQKGNVDFVTDKPIEEIPLSPFHPLIKPVPNLSGINQINPESGLIQPDILIRKPPVQAILVAEDPQVPVNDAKTLPQFISRDRPFPIQNQCHPASTDPNCFVQLSHINKSPLRTDITEQIKVTGDLCQNGMQHPDCDIQECFAGSLDPKCFGQRKTALPHSKAFVPTSVAGESLKEAHCLPGSKDPTCLENLVNQKDTLPPPNSYLETPEGLKYDTKPKEESEEQEIYYKPVCDEGFNDPRCEFFTSLDLETDREKSVEGYPTPLVPYPCLPGSLNPSCYLCDSNSNDPNCKNPGDIDHIPLPLCHPDSENKDCYRSIEPRERKQQDLILFNCLSGFSDPRCGLPLIPQKTVDCSQFATHPECLKEEIKAPNVECFPGSTDQRCISETSSQKSYRDDTLLDCILNPEDIRCQKNLYPKEICGPDSQSPECVGIHNTGKCYPGSEEPNCQRILSDCVQDSSDPKCKEQNKFDECNSQSQDPKCTKTSYSLEECSEYTDDPRCQSRKKEKPGLETDKGKCSVHSTDPECIAEHPVGRECDSQSEDPRCKNVKQIFPLEPVRALEEIRSFKCIDNPNDARCQNEFLATPDCSVQLNNPLCWPTQHPVSECSEDSTNPECVQGVLPKKCDPNSKDSNCGEVPSTSDLKDSAGVVLYDDCIDGSLAPHCKKKINEIPCDPHSTDPQCHEAPKNELSIEDCGHDSTDPKCQIRDVPKIDYFTPSNPTNPIQCTEYSTDPNCFPEFVNIKEDPCPADSADPNCLKECNPTSADPRCHKKPQPQEKFEHPFDCTQDTLHPLCQFGKKNQKHLDPCDENSSNPECIKSSQNVLDCYPGSISPECLREHEPTPPCFPGSNDPVCKKDEASSVTCYPGSEDPDCINGNGASKKCTEGDRNCTAESDISKGCYPGSTEPGCIKDAQISLTCFEGSSDPDCIRDLDIHQICYPGSQDPRCEFGKKIDFENDPKDFKCTDDSTEPKCLKQRLRPTSADAIQSRESLFKKRCFPGSNEPRCKLSDTFRCEPGSHDPKCKKTPPQKPTFGRKTEKSQRKNKKIRKPHTRPTSKQAMMFKGDGDFHGDKDPRYHAFHSWLYKPPPKPRPRGKRSPNQEHIFLMHFNGKNVGAVLPRREDDDAPNHVGESSFHVDDEALLPYSNDYIPNGRDHDERPQPKTEEVTSTILMYSYLCWLTFFLVCCLFLAMLIMHLLLRGNKVRHNFNV